MKCDICGNSPVLIHIQQITGKEEINIHICEKCAKEKGLNPGRKGFPLNIGSLIKNFEEIKRAVEEKDNRRVCPRCGQTFEEFKKSGSAGCEECYDAFRKYIISFLRKNAGWRGYDGKFPRKANILRYRVKNRDSLKSRLARAVERERYEEAAFLRDRLRFVEKQIERDGN